MKVTDHTKISFGKWKIIKRQGSSKGYSQWLRECECGNHELTLSKNLNRGNLDCGCSNSLVGKTFGSLLVKKKINVDLCNSFSNFEVECICGLIKLSKGQS